MILTTLCYIERDGQYLMMHRTKKVNDLNHEKWVGIGGKFEDEESPEDCLLRETREETGLILTSYRFRGVVTFISDMWPAEFMCLYTADGFEGEPKINECREGELLWVPKAEISRLHLWEGDKIFLRLLAEDAPFFSLKLCYEGDVLAGAALNGVNLKL